MIKDNRSKRETEEKDENIVGAKDGSSFRLGDMIDRGCFNYRWPLTDYYLNLHPHQKDVNPSKRKGGTEKGHNPEHDTRWKQPVGTCQMFSCAKDGIFYQILRVEEGGHFDRNSEVSPCCHFPPESQLVITMGGPVWFQCFNEYHEHVLNERGQVKTMATFPISQPRDIQHGQNSQSDADETEKVIDVFEEDEETDTIRYWDEERGIGLEAKVYVFRPEEQKFEPLKVVQSLADQDSGTQEVQGVKAYHALYEFEPLLNKNLDQHRSATFLTAIRLFRGDELGPGKWPELPTSKALYNYVGVNPSSPGATGALWESIFLEGQKQAEPVLDLSEFRMIGRSLEKILQVDIVPATFEGANNEDKDGPRFAALVSNLFIRGKIDFNSLL